MAKHRQSELQMGGTFLTSFYLSPPHDPPPNDNANDFCPARRRRFLLYRFGCPVVERLGSIQWRFASEDDELLVLGGLW